MTFFRHCLTASAPNDSVSLTLPGLIWTATVRPWRSFICQHEGKGVQTVITQYRPSGRAEDHEAGAAGAAGARLVRPAALSAAPGKMLNLSILQKTSYVYIVHI